MIKDKTKGAAKSYIQALDWHDCSICHGQYRGFGHNAEPVNSGRCCDACNDMVVIPTRMNRLIGAIR